MKRARNVSKIKVELDVANNDDIIEAKRGHRNPQEIRRMKIEGIVDPHAAHLRLPQGVANKLGLTATGRVKVLYANHRTAIRPQVHVCVELAGRHSVFSATVDPRRDTALIGFIVLNALDLLIDRRRHRLHPRDPKFITCEIG